jgi:glycosyltransferase involved in cell wall biosynthesis
MAPSGAVPQILTMADYYLPGFRGGGVIRSLASLVECLQSDFTFRIITRDRDLGSTQPYPDLPRNTWVPRGDAECLYLTPLRRTLPGIAWVLRRAKFDLLYLNSVFSIEFTLQPLVLARIGMIPTRPIVLSPKGELDPGALRLRPLEKRIYLRFAKLLGLFAGVVWHASNAREAEQVRDAIGKSAKVMIASDIFPRPESDAPRPTRRAKAQGQIRIAFLSRIAPKKNLRGAIESLLSLDIPTQLDIYGPIEDPVYWRDCQRLIDQLGPDVCVAYRGSVESAAVEHVLAQYDLLFLPTMGENYGYVIVEAMLAGCPVLISDRTAWQDLERRRAGWTVPVDDLEGFRRVIAHVTAMDDSEHAIWVAGARAYGQAVARNPQVVEDSRLLFQTALAHAGPR